MGDTGEGARADGAHAAPRPCVTSVNVGGLREVTRRGQQVRTGIWEASVGTRGVAIRGVNVDGDDQANRVQHGGPDTAVYAVVGGSVAGTSSHAELQYPLGVLC